MYRAGWIILMVMGMLVASVLADAAVQKSGGSVSIVNSSYQPGTVSIKTGQSVTWTNNDDRDHTVAGTDGSFSSGNLKPGQTFTHRFTKAGTYSYGCKLHPRMRGSVTVTD